MVTCCSCHSETHFTHHVTHETHFTHVTKAFLSLSLPTEKERYSVCNRSISLLYWFYIINVSGGPNINQKAGNVRDSDLQGWSQQIVQMAPSSWRVSTNILQLEKLFLFLFSPQSSSWKPPTDVCLAKHPPAGLEDVQSGKDRARLISSLSIWIQVSWKQTSHPSRETLKSTVEKSLSRVRARPPEPISSLSKWLHQPAAAARRRRLAPPIFIRQKAKELLIYAKNVR